MNALSIDTKDVAHFRQVQGLNPQGDGSVTVSNLDGSVVSVQPDGSVEPRVAGTTGAWERAFRDGNQLFFRFGVLLYREGLPD